MARLPRWIVPGQAHYVIQRGHRGQPVFVDDVDRAACLAALREATAAQRVAVHAYALQDNAVHLLLSPPTTSALSRTMQTLGRRYVSAYNRRHACSGTLWDGRFRCAVVEPGPWRLAAMLLIDGQPGATSALHRSGGHRETWLQDPPEFWSLGNTPFDREAAYRTRLVQGVAAVDAARLRDGALGGWPIGGAAFIAEMAAETERPMAPRPRGRPPRAKPVP